MKKCICLFYLMIIPLGLQAATKEAVVVRDSIVKSKPDWSAKDAGKIKKSKDVKVHDRKGAWYKISSSQFKSGWLSMLAVKFKAVARRASESGFKESVGVLTGASKNSNVATAVRGLEERIKTAQADYHALEKMHKLKSNSKKALAFARAAGLKTNPVNIDKE